MSDPQDWAYVDALPTHPPDARLPQLVIPPKLWTPVGGRREPGGRWNKVRARVLVNGAPVCLLATLDVDDVVPLPGTAGRVRLRGRSYTVSGVALE